MREELREELSARQDAALAKSGGIIVYFAWAENAKGQIEQLRVERAGGQPARSVAPNPHKAQTWTGRIFTTWAEAAGATTKLNLLPLDVRTMHSGR